MPKRKRRDWLKDFERETGTAEHDLDAASEASSEPDYNYEFAQMEVIMKTLNSSGKAGAQTYVTLGDPGVEAEPSRSLDTASSLSAEPSSVRSSIKTAERTQVEPGSVQMAPFEGLLVTRPVMIAFPWSQSMY